MLVNGEIDKDGGGGGCIAGAIENTEWGQLKSLSDIEKIISELVRKCETNVPSAATLNLVDYYHMARAIIDAVVYQFTGKNIDEVLGGHQIAKPFLQHSL